MPRLSFFLAIIMLASTIVQAQTSAAQQQPTLSLAAALQQLAVRHNLSIVFDAEIVKGKRTLPLPENLSIREALDTLLIDSGLQAKEIEPGRYSIVKTTTGAVQQTLPEMIVTGAPDPDSPYSTQYQVPKAFVGTKTDTPIMQTPFSVQVVPRPVLQDQQAVRLDTAVQNVSGVVPLGAVNQGASDGFMIRGFNSQTTYRNGVLLPDNGYTGGTIKREMANIERVEVLKGPGSLLFGRADPGGIINTVTKQPLATPYYSLQQQVGSFNFYRTAFDATGPLLKQDNLLYRLNISYENSGSFRDFVENKSVFIAPVIRWNISPRTQITAELEYLSVDNTNDPGIPRIGNRPAPVPRSRYVSEPLHNDHKGDRYFIGVHWSHQFNDNWQISHRLGAELFDLATSSIYYSAALADGTLNRSFFYDLDDRFERYQSSLNLTGKVETGVLKHTLLFGYDYYFLDFVAKGIMCCPAAPAFNIFSPTYLATPFVFDPPSNAPDTKRDQSWHGAYYQHQVELPYNVHLLGGFRYDNAVAHDRTLDIKTGAEDRFSPRGGLLWQPLHWLSLYGSYTENFGPSNTLFSADGISLPPQTAQQWETGLKTEFFGGRLRSSFSYFELTKQGIAVPDPNNPRFLRAIGEAETRGIELDIAGEILPGWNTILTYSYMPFAKITKDVGPSGLPDDTRNQGNRLFQAPKHTGSLWSTYSFQSELLRGLKLGGGIIGVGKRQGNAANAYQLPAYVIGNLMASYQMKMGATLVTAQLNVHNISNEKYHHSNGFNLIIPGAPRTFLGSLRVEY